MTFVKYIQSWFVNQQSTIYFASKDCILSHGSLSVWDWRQMSKWLGDGTFTLHVLRNHKFWLENEYEQEGEWQWKWFWLKKYDGKYSEHACPHCNQPTKIRMLNNRNEYVYKCIPHIRSKWEMYYVHAWEQRACDLFRWSIENDML